MYCYTAYGFTVESDLIFPELETSKGNVDVVIRQKEIETPDSWLENKGIRTLVSLSSIIVGISDIANFEIVDGKYIYYQPKSTFHEGKARLYILGIAFSAIIHQRGLLPLHASALEKNGKAILICGESGAGKSTTAAALLKHGFSLLSDDISLVRINEQKPEVVAGFPHMKLWPESVELLDMNMADMSEFAPDIVKKGLRLQHSSQHESVEIIALCYLFVKEEVMQKTVIQGVEKVKTLIDNTFRLRFVNDTGQHQAYFNTTSRLASCVNMLSISRPTNKNSLSELTSIINNFFKEQLGIHGIN
jgi:energy-coupling factor transporter ATP-binding protein EcfA2